MRASSRGGLVARIARRGRISDLLAPHSEIRPQAVVAKPIRVALVHAHALVRAGLRMLIESRPGFEVVAESDGSAEGLSSADVILLDPDTDSGNRLGLIPRLVKNGGSATRVLVLTEVHDAKVHRRAVQLGATGVILKEAPVDSLLKAIEQVHAGGVWLSRSTVTALLQESAEKGTVKALAEIERAATLSRREREIVALVSKGLKNDQIARELFISNATVRHHLTSIFSKLNVTGRYELISLAYHQGMTASATGQSAPSAIPRR